MEWWKHLDKLHREIMELLNHSTDQVRSSAIDMHDTWFPDGAYTAGTVVRHGDQLYRCLISHTAQPSWAPDVSHSLWTKIMFRDGIRVIPETLTAADAFACGETAWYGDKLYKSKIDGNVWMPDTYPAGWELVKIDIIEGDELQ